MVTIHPTAVVEKNVQLGPEVVIGPYCVIGKGVSIGAGTILDARVVVIGDVDDRSGEPPLPELRDRLLPAGPGDGPELENGEAS